MLIVTHGKRTELSDGFTHKQIRDDLNRLPLWSASAAKFRY